MRKLIFLDIAGVLATPETQRPSAVTGRMEWTFTPRCVAMLQELLRRVPEAELVLTSSWRRETVQATQEHLRAEGLTEDVVSRLVGVTIRGYQMLRPRVSMHMPRGLEIRQWIDHNVHSGGNGEYVLGENGTFVRKRLGLDYVYVILDDATDMLLEQRAQFVRCEPRKGLTRKDVELAARILGGNADLRA